MIYRVVSCIFSGFHAHVEYVNVLQVPGYVCKTAMPSTKLLHLSFVFCDIYFSLINNRQLSNTTLYKYFTIIDSLKNLHSLDIFHKSAFGSNKC